MAGDTFADALAAASLSDPTDRSEQPRLQRVAAQDPLFDPIGGFDRPDTAYAPVVVTTSGRSGASSLASSARVTASDLAKGGCTTAKEAIIVGGTDAVPKGAESDLIGIGYREVFRVAGTDRYETAANVATAMGTAEPTSDTCIDPTTDDGSTRMGWYGNAAFEYRADAHSCRVLPRAVVLADGGTGADALAAGWWTSYWQVPILLTAPDGSLPTATRVALQTMAVDTIVVLGGTARVPETTVDQARFLAGAVAGRIAGADRSQTSIAMAKAFGGWYPTGDGADFADDIACFAASSGTGTSAQGWPDALAAGPMCGLLSATGRASPVRALPPLDGDAASTAATGGRHPAHDAVPMLVLPTGESSAPIFDLLSASFDTSSTWCDGDASPTGCLGPGFGVVIGGQRTIPDEVADDLTLVLSGGSASGTGDRAPTVEGAFPTDLDLSAVFAAYGSGTGSALCVPAGGLRDVRWLSFTAEAERRTFESESDVLRGGAYQGGTTSRATCIRPDGVGSSFASAGVSISGRVSAPQTWNVDPARHLALSQPIEQTGTGALASGVWTTSGAPAAPVTMTLGDQSAGVTSASLSLGLSADPDTGRGLVIGKFTVATAFGSSSGSISADAVQIGDAWEIAGRVTVGPFASGTTLGGFRATVRDAGGSVSVRWRFDGF